jgi:hypothetical protein
MQLKFIVSIKYRDCKIGEKISYILTVLSFIPPMPGVDHQNISPFPFFGEPV